MNVVRFNCMFRSEYLCDMRSPFFLVVVLCHWVFSA
jgi:hypothetical protein